MNPPYSLVCGGGHVLGDEIAHEPPRVDNGARRCSTSGCVERVYSHCENCGRPLPGYLDGVRFERRGNVFAPRGRLNRARGLLPAREWREDCPFCKAPYSWASDAVWVQYHRSHLADVEAGVSDALPDLKEAEARFMAAAARRRDREKEAKVVRRRERWAAAGAKLDTWPKRVGAIAAALATILTLLFGANSFRDLRDGDGVPTPTSPSPSGP